MGLTRRELFPAVLGGLAAFLGLRWRPREKAGRRSELLEAADGDWERMYGRSVRDDLLRTSNSGTAMLQEIHFYEWPASDHGDR